MASTLLKVVERFDTSLQLDDYNAWNSSKRCALHPVEVDLATALADFANLKEEERLEVRARIDLDLAARLDAFATRMAAAAVNRRSVTFLISAVTALILDDDILDDREVAHTLVVIFDAGVRIHEPMVDIVRASCQFAAPHRARLFKWFLETESYRRSPESMGYEFRQGPEGCEYVFNPQF